LWLNVIRARGDVELVQRPDHSNDYTAIILIDDSAGRGAYDYELELAWERRRRYRGDRGRHVDRDFAGVFRWKGSVDKGVRIEIRGQHCELLDEGGQGTYQHVADFTAPLPPEEVPVSLRRVRGRGEDVFAAGEK
jgi:hypothetical protein